MDTCRFTYVQRNTFLPVHALGFEKSWEQLKVEFDCDGPGYPGAMYYKTISLNGPKLFAVVNEEWVLYHDNEQWFRYISATDVKIGRMNIMPTELPRATTEEQSKLYFEMATQEDHVSIPDQDY